MTKPVGIIGAMETEVTTLIDQLEGHRCVQVGDMALHEGVLRGTPVVVMRCGIGKVNAAMGTQALIDRFGPACVINTGAAGSLDPALRIGDLVVSTDLVQHDMEVGGLGFAPGYVPDLGLTYFEADRHLREAFMQAAAEVAPEVTCLAGRIASGDQFVSSEELRRRIIELFDARCCEMEGAAIAQVCHRNHVPYVVVRAMSDGANDESTLTYDEFVETAAHRSAAIVERAVELL